jgi:hypothetical protein
MNTLNKTLEQLENDFWGEPTYSSSLIKSCHALRQKELKLFTVEDLRIMIGQNIGLTFLIPIAIEKLKENILAEGDYHEGDLLKSVLICDKAYWLKEKDNWLIISDLFKTNISALQEFDSVENIRKEWFDAFQVFEFIHVL